MDDETQKIEFRPKVEWNAATEKHLSLIKGLSDLDVAFYRRAVERGSKGLMGVYVNETLVGSIIWCLSDEPKGTVFIVDEMGADCRQGLDLITATDKMAHIFAPNLGAKFLRFMTRRAGLLSKLKNTFETTYIMEKQI